MNAYLPSGGSTGAQHFEQHVADQFLHFLLERLPALPRIDELTCTVRSGRAHVEFMLAKLPRQAAEHIGDILYRDTIDCGAEQLVELIVLARLGHYFSVFEMTVNQPEPLGAKGGAPVATWSGRAILYQRADSARSQAASRVALKKRRPASAYGFAARHHGLALTS